MMPTLVELPTATAVYGDDRVRVFPSMLVTNVDFPDPSSMALPTLIPELLAT